MTIKKVSLSTKKELEIYMNPVRQRLLRQLELSMEPMTPKMLADKLEISASSIQHHIKKLQSLDLVELDHTKLVNGITASYYKATHATVLVGLKLTDDSFQQRVALMQNEISQTFNGFVEQRKKLIRNFEGLETESLSKWGTIINGVMHLTDEESLALMNMINEYIKNHTFPTREQQPWEFSLILYKIGNDDKPMNEHPEREE